MRYVYGVSSALLIGGAAISLATGHPAGAQVAQNADQQISHIVPHAGAPESFADLTEQLQPAVVNIATKQRIVVNTNNNPFAGTPFADLFGRGGGNRQQTRQAQSLGSGFLISSDGYVVTNNHVITAEGQGQVEEITVTLSDGTEYDAELVGADAASDLAVLKISRREAFPFVRFGDSSQARVGDWVVAIGNPFGLSGTVTAGIISAVYRATGSRGPYDRYIQTDTAINRGNSGGPLFDMQGNVIGINNAIFSPSGGSVGLGFAIPAETAAPIVQKLREGEAIERGYLGVLLGGPVNEDLADALGIPENRGELIQSVEPGEAAAKAGMKSGDIVISVNGQDVTPEQNISFLVANIAPGEQVPVEVIRDGKKVNLNITMGKRPPEEELANRMFDPDAEATPERAQPSENGEAIAEAIGLQVTPMTPQIARQLGASDDTTGVVVLAVDPNSDAGQKGLRRGDILLSANYRSLSSVEELESVLAAAQSEGREALLLQVKRRGGPAAYVPVRIRDNEE